MMPVIIKIFHLMIIRNSCSMQDLLHFSLKVYSEAFSMTGYLIIISHCSCFLETCRRTTCILLTLNTRIWSLPAVDTSDCSSTSPLPSSFTEDLRLRYELKIRDFNTFNLGRTWEPCVFVFVKK